MDVTRASRCLLLLFTLFSDNPLSALAGKVLVFPVDGSHWVNMNILIEDLHSSGHEVTVVRTASSWYVKEFSAHYKSITVTLPEAINIESQDFFISYLSQMIELQKQSGSPLAVVEFYRQMMTGLSDMHRQASKLVVEIFENQELMTQLYDARYDVALIDPGLPMGVLVAHKLKLPKVFNARWITSGEGHMLFAPSPISYVPVAGSVLSHPMSFAERVRNTLHYLMNTYIDRFIIGPEYDKLVERYFGAQTDFFHMLQSADIWLMRSDFIFEFPRPTMPNAVYIGGFQCKPSKPLPPDLEDFVQGSGDHGVIVMSLGTLVKGLPLEITSEIAGGFARLPQRVIWRHVGETPANLGNNTLLVNWLPQNDLLGHPKTRLFVAHGGTNGVYETIYHGVPVVGIPLLFDQFDNLLRLEVRGAAKVLDVSKLDNEKMFQAVQEVLHQPSYRHNMQRLSKLHHDKPSPSRKSALFWIEFVMRHKGAAHLRTDSYKMPWYSYHSLDVVVVLIGNLLLAGGSFVVTIRFVCQTMCRKNKSKRE